ncbi:Ribonuclease 3-like protein 2 [Capsicum annuum]|nr:Ribonuclease 3-like protein 2 [Capsicum annuum]
MSSRGMVIGSPRSPRWIGRDWRDSRSRDKFWTVSSVMVSHSMGGMDLICLIILIDDTTTEKLARVAVRYRLYNYLRRDSAILNEKLSDFELFPYDLSYVDCGKLTDLRAANVSTEKLARVAVRHGLYNYLRRDSAILDEKVIGDAALSLAISSYFLMTYPDVDCGKLTDLRVANRLTFIGHAALSLAISSYFFVTYPEIDCGKLTDLRTANVSTEKLARLAVRHGLYNYLRHDSAILDEKIFRGLLEPIIMLNLLEDQPQPVTMLFGLCKKDASSEHKENAKHQVAKAALKESYYNPYDKMDIESVPLQRKRRIAESIPFQKKMMDVESIPFQEKKMDVEFDRTKESEGAKQKLNELYQREKWPKPTYRVEKEIGPAHDRRFICSVQIVIAEGMLFFDGRREVTSKRCREFSSLSNDPEFAGIQVQSYIVPCSNSRMKQTAGDGATWN